MRDPNRLYKFYEQLRNIHMEYFPDLRFGQRGMRKRKRRMEMTAQEAVNKIASHLLGRDWYSYYINHDDINGEIVETICSRYSCKDEDPVDKWRRKHKRCYFCRHVKYLDNPCGTGAFQCQAKTKLVNIETPRPFCGLFELRKGGTQCLNSWTE